MDYTVTLEIIGIGDALRRGFRHCRQRLQILDLLGAKSPSTTGHPHPLHSLEGSLHTPLDYGVNAIVRDSNTYNSDMPNP